MNNKENNETFTMIDNILLLSHYGTYTIDKYSHEIVKFTNNLKSYFPNIERGKECFRALYGYDRICPKCPLNTSKKMIEKYREEPLDVFIEVSINLEENKNGVDYHKINEFMTEVLKYKKINVVGFMMMAIKADTHDDLIKQFKSLKYLKERVEKDFNISMPYLSMGMSDDYKEAIIAGSTHVRLGRVLWKK